MTLVMPSGPSFSLLCARRIRSPAPPGRGLKAVAADAADAAFQNAPAISPLDFLFLIIGPSPGRESSGSGGGSPGTPEDSDGGSEADSTDG